MLSAFEGALLAAAVAAALRLRMEPEPWARAAAGLGAAWGASSVSVTALIFARGGPQRGFIRAFGAGVMLRGLVLAALMAAVMGEGWDRQAPLLGAYALGVMGLLLVEYRHLKAKTE